MSQFESVTKKFWKDTDDYILSLFVKEFENNSSELPVLFELLSKAIDMGFNGLVKDIQQHVEENWPNAWSAYKKANEADFSGVTDEEFYQIGI